MTKTTLTYGRISLTSYGNGWAYEVKWDDGKSLWLQDDDALYLEQYLAKAEQTYDANFANPGFMAKYGTLDDYISWLVFDPYYEVAQ